MMASSTTTADEPAVTRQYITFYPDELLLRFPAIPGATIEYQCTIAVEKTPLRPGQLRHHNAHADPAEESRILHYRTTEFLDKLHEGLTLISNDRRGIQQQLLPQQPPEYPPARFTFGGPLSTCFFLYEPSTPDEQRSTANQAIQLQRKMTRLTRETMLSLLSLLRRYYNFDYQKAYGVAQAAMDDLMKLVEQHAVVMKSSTH